MTGRAIPQDNRVAHTNMEQSKQAKYCLIWSVRFSLGLHTSDLGQVVSSKVGLGSLSCKMSTWLRTVSTLCAPGKIVCSTGVYSPQGPEMVLECSGLMIARGVIVKRL